MVAQPLLSLLAGSLTRTHTHADSNTPPCWCHQIVGSTLFAVETIGVERVDVMSADTQEAERTLRDDGEKT